MKYSLFKDKYSDDMQTLECEWSEFADWVEGLSPVETKHDAPLFSLCTYGDKKLREDGLRRNSQNILEVWGIEVDYDGGSIGFDNAVTRAEQAGIEALIYTSPSHTPDEPRWRMVCPFDQSLDLGEREAAIERINGLFGGYIDPTSFSKSQAFFVGPVKYDSEGNDTLKHYRCKRVVGRSVATAVELPRIPKGQRRRVGGELSDSTEQDYINDVENGKNIHPALRALSWRWSWDEDKLINLAHRSKARTDDNKRYRRMIGGEIRELVEGAREKRLERLSGDVARIEAPPKPPERESVFSNMRQLRRDFPPLEWAIEGIMEAHTIGSVFGPANQGKTFLMVDIACCLATGIDWNGRPVKQGGVLYINGEGERGFARRIAAWLQHNQPEGDWNFPLYVSKRAISLTSPEGAKLLQDEVNHLVSSGQNVDYVIIDTLSRMFDVPQNEQAGMHRVVEICDLIKRSYDCTVILVHHPAKGQIDTGKGAVDLKNSIDFEFGFHVVEDEPSLRVFKCMNKKTANYGSRCFSSSLRSKSLFWKVARCCAPIHRPN